MAQNKKYRRNAKPGMYNENRNDQWKQYLFI